MFNRLNAFGEIVGPPTERPTSRIGQNNQRLIGVLYGHNGSGKVYNYLGGEGLRAGDIVTPEVTHYKSGNTYKTLARIVTTKKATGDVAQNTTGHLSGQGILPKTLGPTDQKSLPGYQARLQDDPSFTAKQWKEEADKQYKQQVMQRLSPMGTPANGNKGGAQ